MMKKFVIITVILCLLLTGCTQVQSSEKRMIKAESTSDETVLITVNGEPIYAEELEKIISKYEEFGLTESEIIEGMILELITLQQAEVFSVSISQEDVDFRYNELSNLGQSLFYEKAIEQYGSEDSYKEALYYKMIYDEVSYTVKNSFSDIFSINNTVLQKRTQDYVSQYSSADFANNGIDEKEFSEEVMQIYYESFFSALEDLYFKVWQYQLLQISELSYDNYNPSNLFQVQAYDINENTLQFKGDSYELIEITLKEIQDRFGNYFYLSDSIAESYGTVSGKAIHVSSEDVRGLYLNLGVDTPVIIKLIISPILSLYNDFEETGIIRGTENEQNKVEYIQPDLGIFYSITADMEYTELEDLLNSCIPYACKNTSDTMTQENGFAQIIELTNGTLVFNECVTPIAADISYFDPDTTYTKKWTLEQVEEYLDISFIPSYIPEDLKLIEDYSADSFISESIDGILYWTVAYDKSTDVLVYDNFGLYYSDTSIGEYNSSQRNLRIEISKEDIPLTDCFFIYDIMDESTIGSVKLAIGSYYDSSDDEQTFIAEFMIDDVGYRISSANLTQEQFVKVLTSLPALQ